MGGGGPGGKRCLACTHRYTHRHTEKAQTQTHTDACPYYLCGTVSGEKCSARSAMVLSMGTLVSGMGGKDGRVSGDEGGGVYIQRHRPVGGTEWPWIRRPKHRGVGGSSHDHHQRGARTGWS